MEEKLLSPDKSVLRQGDVIYRPTGPWSVSVHRLLQHMQAQDFSVPQPLGIADGREMLSFIPGDFVHPRAWNEQGLVEVAKMVRRLHDIAAAYTPEPNAAWQPWFLHDMGEPRIISHGDIAPWNMVTSENGLPIALIDWEYAGPVDPLMEFARVCWLFPQLHDDDLQAIHELPPYAQRARQVRMMAEAYGLSARDRLRLTDCILQVMVMETAQEAIDGGITFDSTGPQWGLAWRARSAGKLVRHREELEKALM